LYRAHESEVFSNWREFKSYLDRARKILLKIKKLLERLSQLCKKICLVIATLGGPKKGDGRTLDTYLLFVFSAVAGVLSAIMTTFFPAWGAGLKIG
jgi:hypothetical protein